MASDTESRWSSSGSGTMLLNSERIRKRYGSCSIRVLDQHDGLRRTGLFSSEDGQETCRTFATVRFATEIPEELEATHATITAGASIGFSLAASNLPIIRRTLGIRTVRLDHPADSWIELMRIDLPATLAAHVYQLDLARGSTAAPYATIAELHHPVYLTEAALRAAYTIDSESRGTSAICDDMIALARQFESAA